MLLTTTYERVLSANRLLTSVFLSVDLVRLSEQPHQIDTKSVFAASRCARLCTHRYAGRHFEFVQESHLLIPSCSFETISLQLAQALFPFTKFKRRNPIKSDRKLVACQYHSPTVRTVSPYGSNSTFARLKIAEPEKVIIRKRYWKPNPQLAQRR